MAYDTEVLADSPFLYWDLAETVGTTATDQGSGAHNGTYMGDYTLTDDWIAEGTDPDKAVRLNASTTTGAIESGVISGFPSTSLTVELWMREGAASTNDTLFCYGNASFGRAVCVRNETDQVQLYINGSSVLSGVVGTRFFDRGVHIVVTWDNASGDYQFYLDGMLRGTGTVAAAGTITDGGLVVVGQAWSSAPPVTATYVAGDDHKGWIQQVAVYPTVLSASRIWTHFFEGKRVHEVAGPSDSGYEYYSEVLALGTPVTTLYYQRIYDTVNKEYVYYTKTLVDVAPLPAETTPNHSGSLDTATHEILEIR